MTTPHFADYSAPEFAEGDVFKPIDNLGHTCIVMVNEHKPSVVTSNTPDGGPAVIVDLVDLDGAAGPAVYRDVLWMSGAVVDGLKSHAGSRKPVLITFEGRKSKSGRNYPCPAAVDAAQSARATEYYQKNGDPFAQQFASPAAAPGDPAPPF